MLWRRGHRPHWHTRKVSSGTRTGNNKGLAVAVDLLSQLRQRPIAERVPEPATAAPTQAMSAPAERHLPVAYSYRYGGQPVPVWAY